VVHPVMRKFVEIYSNDERFYFVDLQASADQIHIEMWDWLWGIDWTFPRCDCQDPRLTLRDDADLINDLAGDARGLRFEDLFLDDRAAQIYGGQASRRNIHTLGDLKSKGW